VIARLVAALRRWLRAHPQVERRVLSLIAPLIPFLISTINRLRGPRYGAWFARWQAGAPADDGAIIAALGAEPPPFLVVVGEGERGRRTRDSVARQVGVAWTAAGTTADLPPQGLVLILDQGETLERHALAAFAIAAREAPRTLVVYADEDVRDADGTLRDPWFKAAFDPDRLLQQDSLGRAVAFDAALLRDNGLSGLRGHALALAATRAAGPASVRHVPAVLLHRDASAPPMPWRAGTDPAAVAAAIAPEGARIADPAARPLRIAWPLPEPAPMVSIIIPTRDRAALLGPCLEGLFTHTDYPAFEVIVVDNGSTEPALHDLLARWSADGRLRVLPSPGPFNYALLNNAAAAIARGEILLLLNNDTEVTHPGWLTEMAAQAMRPGIGAVGAKLFFPTRRIQHAGVILGPRGVAGHDYLFAPADEPGQQDDLNLMREVSAVTGACLAVRRAHYLAVGGLDEARFQVAYNDVDFCLKLRRAGLRNLFTPHARLLHHESASRGSDFSAERHAKWDRERLAMREEWGTALDDDPFFPALLSFSAPARTPAIPPRCAPAWRKPPLTRA
jgi:GT2 family glycosyltransferase